MERIWYDEGRENFYAIPEGTELEAGDYLLRSLTATSQRVDRDAARPYWITKADATERLGATVDSAWGGLVGVANSLFAMGRAESDGDAEEARPSVLPEHLEDLLGMKPGALLTEPETVRQKLRDTFGLQIRTGEDAGPSGDDIPVDIADAEEVPPEPEPESEPDTVADPVRDFFSRPEVSGAIAGLGRALSKLGAQIQDAAVPKPEEEADDGEA